MRQPWNRGTDTVSLVCIFRSIPVQLSGVAVCSHVMNTGQCHPKTIRSQYHHSQALQLTVDSFLKRFFAVKCYIITVYHFSKSKNKAAVSMTSGCDQLFIKKTAVPIKSLHYSLIWKCPTNKITIFAISLHQMTIRKKDIIKKEKDNNGKGKRSDWWFRLLYDSRFL